MIEDEQQLITLVTSNDRSICNCNS